MQKTLFPSSSTGLGMDSGEAGLFGLDWCPLYIRFYNDRLMYTSEVAVFGKNCS